MKKILIVSMAVLSFSTFAQSETFELKVTKEEYSQHQQKCMKDLISEISKDIFQVEPYKMGFDGYKMHAEVKDQKRRMQITMDMRDSDSYTTGITNHYWANLTIEVNNLKHFNDHPYISKLRTNLLMYNFPKVELKSTKNLNSRDTLGNPMYGTDSLWLSITIPDGKMGLLMNDENDTFVNTKRAYVLDNLFYKSTEYIQCLKEIL
jgi:hypothetical protein